MSLLFVVFLNSVCRYCRGIGIEARRPAGHRHLVLAFEPALERRARLEQAKPHVDAGAPVFLLHDRQVALQASCCRRSA